MNSSYWTSQCESVNTRLVNIRFICSLYQCSSLSGRSHRDITLWFADECFEASGLALWHRCILIPRYWMMASIQSNEVVRPAHSGFTFRVCGPLNMCSSVFYLRVRPRLKDLPPSPPPHDDKVSSCATLYLHFRNVDIIRIERANITYPWFAETYDADIFFWPLMVFFRN